MQLCFDGSSLLPNLSLYFFFFLPFLFPFYSYLAPFLPLLNLSLSVSSSFHPSFSPFYSYLAPVHSPPRLLSTHLCVGPLSPLPVNPSSLLISLPPPPLLIALYQTAVEGAKEEGGGDVDPVPPAEGKEPQPLPEEVLAIYSYINIYIYVCVCMYTHTPISLDVQIKTEDR